MAKRPRLSAHLRLADPVPDESATRPGPDAPPPPDPPQAAAPPRTPPRDQLVAIVDDAAADMTRIAWLGWSKAWEVQLRLTRYWLGLDRGP